jgi:hypothetical protein
MTWTSPISDLRTLLSDGPTDKLRAFKTVFGVQNGTNTTFKTFEFRRITDFSSSGTAFPLGVCVNGVLYPAASVTVDDPETGFFSLAAAPSATYQLLATYYTQWFLDAELDQFLVEASNWLGSDSVYANTVDGLKTAALKYAAHTAYQKLSLKYAENITDTYRTQDSPDESKNPVVDAYQKAATQSLKEAYQARDDYYKRKGQAFAPNSVSIGGTVYSPTRS